MSETSQANNKRIAKNKLLFYGVLCKARYKRNKIRFPL